MKPMLKNTAERDSDTIGFVRLSKNRNGFTRTGYNGAVYQSASNCTYFYFDKHCAEVLGESVVLDKYNLTVRPADITDKKSYKIFGNGLLGVVMPQDDDELAGTYEMYKDGDVYKLYKIEE